MKTAEFGVGYGIAITSLHCEKCGFNITDPKKLKHALAKLRKRMEKNVKIVHIGAGIGIRFPNEFVKSYNLKAGVKALLKPEADGIKIVT
jgi:hypothetical protein